MKLQQLASFLLMALMCYFGRVMGGVPTAEPTAEPTPKTTAQPSPVPTPSPTSQPSSLPSSQPSLQPSASPSEGIYSPQVDDFTMELLTAVTSGSVSDVKKAFEILGLEGANKNNQIFTSLIRAIYDGRPHISRLLVDLSGISINTQGITGNSPLMFAAMWGQQTNVQYLLEQGADTNLSNKDGETALSLALKNGYSDIATLIRYFNDEL